MNLKENIKKHLTNIPGWRTSRKIIVFESDDWGAIRMSSKKNLFKLADLGIDIQKCHYVRNDTLASEEDLFHLFEVLRSYKDSKDNKPVITANVIMTNPHFEKIKASGFKEYYYELFTESLARYSKHQDSFNQWKEGIKEGLFYPQFHGREHLQVLRWMNFLNKPNSETRKAFDMGVYGLSSTVTSENRRSYMASYDWDDRPSQSFILDSVSEGLSLFKSVFSYNSLSAIAPNYTWHHEVEKIYADHGVRYIQGSSVQKSPTLDGKGYQKIRHSIGQKNDLGQTYLIRNCKFEPSSNPGKDWVDHCMSEIATAFLWKKPAIIEIHRVNFIGFISSKNRDRNLQEFDRLLSKILKKWPEVEFMTSDQLGKMIENDE